MPSATDPVVWEFEAIGAPWRLDVHPGRESAGGTDADRVAVDERIAQFDRDWSRFRDDSRIAAIARTPGQHSLAADAGPLMRHLRELYEVTNGRVNPLVGRSLEQLGYDATYRLTPAGDPIAAPAWDDAIALTKDGGDGALALDTASPVVLDVGAAGKGYLVDLVAELLLERGAAGAVVDGSGDLRAAGEASIRVGLENPANSELVVGVVELAAGRALAASAPNRRAWGPGLHHLVDAMTGRPLALDVIATWAVADSALVADGAATALFLGEPTEIAERLGVEYVRMHADGRLEASPGWEGELFR
ncbi:thiamine biosynthesis lipoprotein [Microcella alkaliphila]|uniref:FAD:protein FMN transferase n=1 Tax=Microcella alkaliphila TaxID=279828 RepID=A0A4Q7TFM9_9MICO|nr:FAD:protein FMN transferase [Microcella alkaliphila]RZT58330.1 thiamine biosynthesis lipoprotein [Microcella alkaliphila]